MRYLLFVVKGNYELKFQGRDLVLLRSQGKRFGQYRITDPDGDVIEQSTDHHQIK